MLTPKQKAKFEANILPEPNSGCWLWMGSLDKNGYGQIHRNHGFVFAHRVSYEHYRERISDGMVIDHLCRVTACVNPDHLEEVTREENTKRGLAPSILLWKKSECKHGHSLSGSNLRILKNGRRVCKSCDLMRVQAYQKRKRLRELEAAA